MLNIRQEGKKLDRSIIGIEVKVDKNAAPQSYTEEILIKVMERNSVIRLTTERKKVSIQAELTIEQKKKEASRTEKMRKVPEVLLEFTSKF